MRAIFINAVDRKVEEIQIENELHAFYERIGCDMIQCIDVGESNLLVCDEEGRLRDWKVGFRWPGSEGIAGNALLVSPGMPCWSAWTRTTTSPMQKFRKF